MLAELAVGQLIRRGSDEIDQQGQQLPILTIHRSLQEGLLLRLNREPERRQVSFERAVSILRESFYHPSNQKQREEEIWPLAQQILPHLQNVVIAFNRSHPPIQPTLPFAELLADVGGIEMYNRGFAVDARILLQKADKILGDLQGPSATPLRADVLTLLGLCNDALGISERAESHEVRQRALELRQELFDSIPRSKRTLQDEKNYSMLKQI